jgi:hypothetical protein
VFLRITDIIENQTNPVVSSSHYWILNESVRLMVVSIFYNLVLTEPDRIVSVLLGTNERV